jgi:uncharacterized tellurite resistance protein B-like protein
MIDLVKKFFSKCQGNAADEPGVDKSHDVRIATCALFLEMAQIDGEFSGTERDHIIQTLKKDYELADDYIAELLEASKEELKGSIDLWRFTNLINQNYTLEEKIQVIEMTWRLAYADGNLDKHEDYLAHKLANLLRLNHKQLIEAKLRVIRGGAA